MLRDEIVQESLLFPEKEIPVGIKDAIVTTPSTYKLSKH